VTFRRARILPALLLVLGLLLFFANLRGRDLWEPNEPIAAQAVREMRERGDWLLPTVNGEMYPDKPPLLFWGIGLASLIGGRVTETTARIPSATAALVLILAVYLLVRRELGEHGAFLAAATLAVSTFLVEQARYVQHDMLLCLGITVATLALFRIADEERPHPGWYALTAVSLSAGILGKGPVGAALPALILGLDSLLDRRLFRRWGRLALAGALGCVLPAVYYLVLAGRHGTDLLETFLYRHNVERFTAGFDHLHPWWFYLARAPVDLLPATLILPAAFFLQPGDEAGRRLHRRMWIWVLAPIVFFSFSAAKRPVYVLPCLPAAAVLAGWTIHVAAGMDRGGWPRRLAAIGQAALLGAILVAGAAAPVLAARKAPGLLPAAWILAVTAAAGFAAGAILLSRGRLAGSYAALLAAVSAIWLVGIFRVQPEVNRINSPRPFAEVIRRSVPPEAELRTFGLYRFRSGYLFYAGRLMPRLEDPPALLRYLRSPSPVYCILPREDYQDLRGTLPEEVHLIAEGGAGRRQEVLISNRRPGGPASRDPGSPGTDPPPRGPAARSGSGP
jgi:4-amino-4-deoxy-L-arabinose transferase-like glycosyltransferase